MPSTARAPAGMVPSEGALESGRLRMLSASSGATPCTRKNVTESAAEAGAGGGAAEGGDAGAIEGEAATGDGAAGSLGFGGSPSRQARLDASSAAPSAGKAGQA